MVSRKFHPAEKYPVAFITLVFRMYDIVSGKSLRKAIAYVTKIGVTQLIDDNEV